ENPEIVAYTKPELTVDTSVFEGAGCPLDSTSSYCYLEEGPLVELGCRRISAPDSLLGGLDPSYPIAKCGGVGISILAQPAIYEVGYMLRSGVGYVVYRDNAFQLVSSERELRKLYAPIDSPEEALSYALAATGYFAFFDTEISSKYEYLTDRIENTHVKRTNDGYLVLLYDYIPCGCGRHGTFAVDVYIRQSGKIEITWEEMVYRDENMRCYD
ncbi:MAG: hypothetical protein JXA42_10310, partial [Anaerolineales bacterium]|nr:hypothetical protein [Anaerolineales bacterium]